MKRHASPSGHALVICNGDVPAKRRIAPLLHGNPFILCADGGANKARQLGIRPHAIVGDMDSITKGTLRYFSAVETIQVQDQYSTDLEKALDFLAMRQIRSAVVIGATGGRSDHSFANFSIMKKYRKRIHLQFLDSFCEIQIVDRKIAFGASVGSIISLMPMGRCEGITTTGLKYPLSNESLELGIREGTSNEVVSPLVKIEVRKGNLLLFIVAKE